MFKFVTTKEIQTVDSLVRTHTYKSIAAITGMQPRRVHHIVERHLGLRKKTSWDDVGSVDVERYDAFKDKVIGYAKHKIKTFEVIEMLGVKRATFQYRMQVLFGMSYRELVKSFKV